MAYVSWVVQGSGPGVEGEEVFGANGLRPVSEEPVLQEMRDGGCATRAANWVSSQALYKGVREAVPHEARCPEEQGSGDLVPVEWGRYGGCASSEVVKEGESQL